MGKYRYVSIPTELIEQVEKIVEFKKFGYRSIAEFVVDATRRRLENIFANINEQSALAEAPAIE